MKEVYNFTRGNQVAVHPYTWKKKNLHGPRLHTNLDIFCKTTYIFTRLSHTKSVSFWKRFPEWLDHTNPVKNKQFQNYRDSLGRGLRRGLGDVGTIKLKCDACSS